MLVLSRHVDEVILIGRPGQTITLVEPIKLIVVDIRGDKVRLGFEAQSDITILRLEVKPWLNK
jgi:carbon storage regulator